MNSNIHPSADALNNFVEAIQRQKSRGLSRLQRSILSYVLRRYEYLEVHGDDFDRDEMRYWGVPWRTGRRGGSERAAISRALRRLEARGLVQRRNSRTGDRFHEGIYERPQITRTMQVKLTPEGRRVAESVNKQKVSKC